MAAARADADGEGARHGEGGEAQRARGGGGVGGDAELVEGVVAPGDDGELGVSGAEKRNGEKLLAVEGIAERAVV